MKFKKWICALLALMLLMGTALAAGSELGEYASRVVSETNADRLKNGLDALRVDPALTAAAQDAGVSVILWSVDPEDWDVHKRDTVLPRILRGAAPGAIILMHDLSENSVNAALRAVDTLQAEGWQFYTVSELARSAGAELTPGGVYSSFPPKAKD